MYNRKNSGIKVAAIISYIAIFVNIVAGLLYTPWMIEQIGKSDYGLYTLAIAIIGLFTFDFGIGEAVSRFLSKFNLDNDRLSKSKFLGITFRLYLYIDLMLVIMFSLILIFSKNIFPELTQVELERFRLTFTIAGLYSIIAFPFQPLEGILISHEKFIFKKIMELINRVFVVITMTIVLILGMKLYALVVVNALVGIVVIFVKILYLNKEKIVEVDFKSKDKQLLKDIAMFSSWTAIISFANRMTFNIAPVVLAAVAGTIEITYFGIASTIEGYFFTFSYALNGLFLPRVTKIIYNADTSESLETLMIRVGRIQFLIMGLLFVGFFNVGKEFLTLWLNSEYKSVYYMVLVLITPSLVTLTQSIGSTALYAKNILKYKAYSLIITGVISAILSVILGNFFGSLGVSISIAIGTSIGSIIYLNTIFKRKLGIRIYAFFREVHYKMIMPFILSILFGYILNYLISDYSILGLLSKIVSVTVFYSLGNWFFVFNKYEKELIIAPINLILSYFR